MIKLNINKTNYYGKINTLIALQFAKKRKHTYREVYEHFFNELTEEYIKMDGSPKTLNDIRWSNDFILKDDLSYCTIADMYVEDLTPLIVKAMKKSIIRANEHFSHKSLKKIMGYIDKVLAFAVDAGYQDQSFLLSCKLNYVPGKPPTNAQAKRNYLSSAEYKTFMETYNEIAYSYFEKNELTRIHKANQDLRDIPTICLFKEILFKAFFTFIFYTGFRKNEARGVKWKDLLAPTESFPFYIVTFEKQYCDKCAKYVHKGDHTRRPKTRKSIRICGIHDDCYVELYRLKLYLLSINAYDPEQFIFTDFYCKSIKPIPETNIDRCFRKILDNTDIESKCAILDNTKRKVTIHGSRHTACSILLDLGMTIDDVAAFLGHANTSQVEYVYSHIVNPQNIEEERLIRNIQFFKSTNPQNIKNVLQQCTV